MISYITEHQYYMEIEDMLYNQRHIAILLFVEDTSDKEFLESVDIMSDEIDRPVYCLDIREGEEIMDELIRDSSVDSVELPVLIIFDGIDSDCYKVFDINSDATEVEEYLKSIRRK